MPFGLDANTATTFVVPIAQQAAQTVPSVLPSYKQTMQAVSPYLPLSIQPDNDNKGTSESKDPSLYAQASQHFKAGALPWVGDSGATQANTGLWYLSQALQSQWKLQQLWQAQLLYSQNNTQRQLMMVQARLNAVEQSNRSLNNALIQSYLAQSPQMTTAGDTSNKNLNVMA